MARAGVNFVQISKAADSLLARGLVPTVERVRLELGTGSSSTIAPLLKQWKSLRGDADAAGGLPIDLIDAVKSLHERLQSAADAKINSAESEQHRVLASLKQSLDDANNTSAQLKNQQQSLELQLNSMTSKHQSTLKELDTLRVSESVTRTQCDGFQERLTELKSSYDELKHENRTTREQAEHYQQHMASDRHQEREQFRYTVQQLQIQLDQSLLQYQKLDRQYHELHEQKKSADLALEQCRVQQLIDQQNVVTLRSELSTLSALHQDTQNQLSASLAKESEEYNSNTQLRVELEVLQHDYRRLQTSWDQQEARLASTLEQLNELTDANHILLQEKATIQGQLTQLQQALPVR
jgi:chromosome segregation ATPase